MYFCIESDDKEFLLKFINFLDRLKSDSKVALYCSENSQGMINMLSEYTPNTRFPEYIAYAGIREFKICSELREAEDMAELLGGVVYIQLK